MRVILCVPTEVGIELMDQSSFESLHIMLDRIADTQRCGTSSSFCIYRKDDGEYIFPTGVRESPSVFSSPPAMGLEKCSHRIMSKYSPYLPIPLTNRHRSDISYLLIRVLRFFLESDAKYSEGSIFKMIERPRYCFCSEIAFECGIDSRASELKCPLLFLHRF